LIISSTGNQEEEKENEAMSPETQKRLYEEPVVPF
jgi:hypothetical protein